MVHNFGTFCVFHWQKLIPKPASLLLFLLIIIQTKISMAHGTSLSTNNVAIWTWILSKHSIWYGTIGMVAIVSKEKLSFWHWQMCYGLLLSIWYRQSTPMIGKKLPLRDVHSVPTYLLGKAVAWAVMVYKVSICKIYIICIQVSGYV